MEFGARNSIRLIESTRAPGKENLKLALQNGEVAVLDQAGTKFYVFKARADLRSSRDSGSQR